MRQVNLAEAKAKLSHFVNQAAKGKGIIIAKSGIPVAKLVPLDNDQRQAFKFGTLAHAFTDEVIEAIEAPLPSEILEVMTTGSIQPNAHE